MATHHAGLTYEDYAALPDDGRRYELHEGELSVTPSPNLVHQRLLRDLSTILVAHVRHTGAGEVLFAPFDVILSRTSVVQPDILFVASTDAARVSERGIEGPPTLVIEILSPSTTTIDRATKLRLYARHGVPYYWIVDPDARAIEANELAGGAYRLVAAARGVIPVSLPPFADLAFAPESLFA